MKRFCAIFILFLSIGFCVRETLGQKKFLGIPIVEHFDQRDHRGHFISEGVTQDYLGLIYVAQGQVVIAYDGTSWEQVYYHEKMYIREILADLSGRIYIGGEIGDFGSVSPEFGYLFPARDGTYRYHTLTHFLPSNHNERGAIDRIIPYDGGYVFAGVDGLYFYHGDTVLFQSTDWPDGFYSYSCNGKLYMNLRGENEGLAVLRGDQWEFLPRGSTFSNWRVRDLICYSNSALLACTVNNGIYLIDDKGVSPFAEEQWDELREGRISRARKLRDGCIAIGTQRNGLYVLDPDGKLVYHFDRNRGLGNNAYINDLFQDRSGHIWVAMDNGLARIDWESPFSILDRHLGLEDIGTEVLATDHSIYFGTSKGLFVTENEWPVERIERYNNFHQQINDIQEINGDVLVSGDFRAYQLVDDELEEITTSGGWLSFRETGDPDIIIAGHQNGLYRFIRKNGKWNIDNKYAGFDSFTREFEFDDQDRLWTTDYYSGVNVITFREGYQEIESIVHYDTTNGLPSNVVNIFEVDEEILFTINDGVYVFDQNESRFISSSLWNGQFNKGGSHLYELAVDITGNIYYNRVGEDPARLIRQDYHNYVHEQLTLPFTVDLFTNISFLDDNSALIALPEGFLHFNPEQVISSGTIGVSVRKVILSKTDSTIFFGNHISKGKAGLHQSASHIPTLTYDDNSLVFAYSTVDQQLASTFRYYLDGYESTWSDWTEKSEKEYTNLWEGDYTFKVQTMDRFQQLSPVAAYSFTILPPWFRTWYAYCSFSACFIGFFGSIFLLYRQRKKGEIGRLKKKQLETEIQHKQAQLATSAMHLIEKTDFIDSIKARIHEILNQEKVNVNRELKRIIKEIDRNGQQKEAWEEFERHFDLVHAGFLQRLQKDHPRVTPQEVKLSAYLRMNMSTKEIANLLQVSIRGVEKARYRLRKKLKLDPEDNLVSFMMNYNS